jgi:hypothetical protein
MKRSWLISLAAALSAFALISGRGLPAAEGIYIDLSQLIPQTLPPLPTIRSADLSNMGTRFSPTRRMRSVRECPTQQDGSLATILPAKIAICRRGANLMQCR